MQAILAVRHNEQAYIVKQSDWLKAVVYKACFRHAIDANMNKAIQQVRVPLPVVVDMSRLPRTAEKLHNFVPM